MGGIWGQKDIQSCVQVWMVGNEKLSQRQGSGYVCKEKNYFSGDVGFFSYTEVVNNVQKEETVFNIQFVLLDCSYFKFSLVQYCNEWQNKFTILFKEMVVKRFLELYIYLKENSEKYGFGYLVQVWGGQVLFFSFISIFFVCFQNQSFFLDVGGIGRQFVIYGYFVV